MVGGGVWVQVHVKVANNIYVALPGNRSVAKVDGKSVKYFKSFLLSTRVVVVQIVNIDKVRKVRVFESEVSKTTCNNFLAVLANNSFFYKRNDSIGLLRARRVSAMRALLSKWIKIM